MIRGNGDQVKYVEDFLYQNILFIRLYFPSTKFLYFLFFGDLFLSSVFDKKLCFIIHLNSQGGTQHIHIRGGKSDIFESEYCEK